MARYTGCGGRELRYRIIEASPQRGVLLYCHGIESHGTWFIPAAEKLAEHGYTTFLLDRRGSGLNRGASPGDAADAKTLLDDVRLFRAHIGDPTLGLVGLSWGGKLATAAAITRPERVSGLVLITPGLKARVDLPVIQKLRLLFSLPLGGRARLPVPIHPEMFTRTPRFLEFIQQDPWRLHGATARFFVAGLSLDRTIRKGLHRLNIPTLLFLAGQDRIIDNEGVRKLLSQLPQHRLQSEVFADATHAIQFDQTAEMTQRMVTFMERTGDEG